MQEIKFRAKEIATGEWLIGSLQPKDNEVSLAIFFACLKTGRLVDETLGHYTGLKDKNGALVFESDIIKDDKGNILYLEWCDNYASFLRYTLDTQGKRRVGAIDLGAFPKHVEVIGNIYENPELLKEVMPSNNTSR